MVHEVIRRDRDVRLIDNFQLIRSLTIEQDSGRKESVWKNIINFIKRS